MAELAREPAGYWTGLAHGAVIAYLDRAHRKLGVTQRHWMTFNALIRAGRGLTRAELTDELAQYFTPQIGGVETYGEVLDDLLRQGYVVDVGGRLEFTGTGREKREEIAAHVSENRAHLHEGIDDADYATTVTVLRRLAANARR